MSIHDLLEEKREEIQRIAARHGVTRLRLFGSAARGQAGAESDLDFLIETGPKVSAWFPAGLVLDLEAALGRPVDVVTERGLHPRLRDQVLRDAKPL